MSDAPSTSTSPTRRSTTARSPGSCSNRPDTRNAQHRAMLVELERRVPARRGRRHRAGRDPRWQRADVLVGPRHRQQGDVARSCAATNPHPTATINGGTREGAENLDAAGVALLLPEHAAVAEPAQDHHRPGARRRVRGRPDAHVGVRPHRRRRGHDLRRRRRHPPRHVRRRVLRATRGSSAPARPRSSCSPATRSTPRRRTASAW